MASDSPLSDKGSHLPPFSASSGPLPGVASDARLLPGLLYLPGLITPMRTPGVQGGVNFYLLHAHRQGLLVTLQPYPLMRRGDRVDVYWGKGSFPAASAVVQDEHVGQNVPVFVPVSRVPEGISSVHCTVIHDGDGTERKSAPLNVLVRLVFPGGTDPEPDVAAHQRLLAPQIELPASGVIDEAMAKAGTKVVIAPYRNMREFDTIQLSWQGEFVEHEVSPDEVGVPVTVVVPEAVIHAAGDGDDLIVLYRLFDEVHNASSEWSLRSRVNVEVGQGLHAAPLVVNPDGDADPYEIIDLQHLNEGPLAVQVVVMRDGPIQVGDGVALCWTGIGVEGEKQVFESPAQSVRRVPSVLRFDIPAEHFSALSGGRATAHYIVYRKTLPGTRSRRAMASFAGVGGPLPAPAVAEAQDGEVPLELIQDHMTVVIAPWPGMRPGQTVRVSWRGENGIAHDEDKPLDAGLVGEEVKVFIARPLLEGYAGSRIEISYRVDENGRPSRTSLARLIRIVGRAPALPVPQVLQARQTVLDPFDALPEATVRVAADAELGFGDEVELHWVGDQPGGVAPPSSRHVYRELAGKPLDFKVDGAFVALNAGGSVEVSYKVFRLDGRVSQSAPLILSVLPLSLPAPVFLEAEGDRLDPDTLGQGATVVIDASARLRAGDRLTLLLKSPNAAGEAAITRYIDRDDQPLQLNLAHSLIEASNGHRVSLQYRVERGTGTVPRPSSVSHWRVGRVIASGPFSILGARHNHSTYRAWSAPCRLSAIEPRSLQPMQLEWSYAGSNIWTTASQWVDSRPWLKLYVRSASDALQLNPVNLLGNGNGWASAWVALRDEVVAADGAKVDLVAWGDEALGGIVEPALAAVKDIVEVSATRSAYAARRANGDVLCWGVAGEGGLLPAEAGGDFIEVRGNATVFAARKRDGSLVAWGNPTDGGKLPENLAHYRDYTALYGGGRAMAARRTDGTLVAWGAPDAGGQMVPGQEHYTDIGQVLGNYEAFIGLRGEGAAARLIAWGDATAGGALPDAIAHLDNVTALAAATARAFCVLVGNGQVRAWGMEDYGGVVPPAIAELTDVIEVTATWYAFCARLGDGRVAVWGDERYGGALPEHVGECTDIVQVVGSAWSFAALRKDGSVLTWGLPECGGDSADVADQLLDVRAIYANNNSFAALTQDGRVVTWGSEKSGGDSSSQQGELRGKVTSARSISLAEAAAGSSGTVPPIQ